jgi:hypothetical protein
MPSYLTGLCMFLRGNPVRHSHREQIYLHQQSYTHSRYCDSHQRTLWEVWRWKFGFPKRQEQKLQRRLEETNLFLSYLM